MEEVKDASKMFCPVWCPFYYGKCKRQCEENDVKKFKKVAKAI